MIYRRLGKTDLMVSAIGFGGIPIQRISREEASNVMKRASELGINYIDTARGYGVSEEYIGEALKGSRDKWIIATKSMSRTKELMQKDIETSLKNLQTDYIDLYQIHNPKDESVLNEVINEGGALEALLEAKSQGKIRHIGVTIHSIGTLKVAVEKGVFETIMFPYSLVETQAEEVFKRARELDLGIIAMKPMAGGVITDASLAMRYILQNGDVTIAIPGMRDIKEVEQNALAASDFKPLSKEELEKCREIANSLGETFCRRCGYCGPCTKGLDIPMNFTLKLYHDNYDLQDWALERYKALQFHAEDCIECGKCELKCPYDLPIRDMLKEVKKTFKF
jgi:uncharacterized protein